MVIASPHWRAYYELCKPRVVALMLLTALVGMLLAAPSPFPWENCLLGLLGIGLSAGSGAALNHMADYRIDAEMGRTRNRPIPVGKVSLINALLFAAVLGILGLGILIIFVNTLTAILTLISLIGYAFIYTLFLKHATAQNIVIGGLAGAAPPLLGWTAITGQIDYPALLLVLIIFIWTPPHFWALAIYRFDDYAKANVPMMPVVYGIPFTKLNILLYTYLLFGISLMPFVVKMSGVIYLIGALLLGIGFIYWATRLKRSSDKRVAIKTFNYSIIYLMALFVVLLIDHYFLILI